MRGLKWMRNQWFIVSIFGSLLGASFIGAAQAAPTPAGPGPLPPFKKDWNEISVRVDLRNLVGPNDEGKVQESFLSEKFQGVNDIWSQCSIRFTIRSVANVSSAKLNTPYVIQKEVDLSRLAEALNPHGFNGAIPVTVAGQWQYYDPSSGLYPHGLGWVFMNGQEVGRIGAMIAAQKLPRPSAGAIIAHEIAHALNVPHSPIFKNLMGPGGTDDLTIEQCTQAREFAQGSLKSFLN